MLLVYLLIFLMFFFLSVGAPILLAVFVNRKDIDWQEQKLKFFRYFLILLFFFITYISVQVINFDLPFLEYFAILQDLTIFTFFALFILPLLLAYNGIRKFFDEDARRARPTGVILLFFSFILFLPLFTDFLHRFLPESYHGYLENLLAYLGMALLLNFFLFIPLSIIYFLVKLIRTK